MASNEQEISLSIEETNKLRLSLGLPLLKTENDVAIKEKAQVQAKEDFERKREKEKARKELTERIKQEKLLAPSAKTGSLRAAKSGLGAVSKKDDDIDDTLAWASKLGQKQVKAQKKVEKQRNKELQDSEPKEYRENELQGLKVSHRIDDLHHETILVLKDSQINDDDEQVDELMNVNIADLDQARKAQILKKGPKKHDPYEEFDRAQMGLDKKILSYYDDPTADDEDAGFILGAKGQVNYSQEVKAREEKKILGVVPTGGITLDYDKTKEMADFYTKEEVLAFKKPKKKKKASRKRKTLDDEGETNEQQDSEMIQDGPAIVHESFSNSNKSVNIGATNFVDDDDLQALLAKSRKKAISKSNVALRLLEEAAEEATYLQDDEMNGNGGLVISDLTEFVGTLSNTSALVTKPSKVYISNEMEPKVKAIKDEDDMDVEESEEKQEDLEEGEEIEEEDHVDLFDIAKPVVKGLAATLSLLKAKGDIKEASTEDKERNAIERERLEWLAEQRRKDAMEERRLERERALRRDGKQPRMDDWERQQQIREAERIKAEEVAKRYEGYKPNFDITYRDEHGRELNSKEAFKELAQKFHGHKSGKKKTEKKLLKLQEEIKIKNMSSTDTLLQSANRFADQAEKTGNAYLTLSKGGKDVIPEVDLSTLISSTGKNLKSKPSKGSLLTKQEQPSSQPQGFQMVESAAIADTSNTVLPATSVVPESRPKIAFGLSIKKGKLAK